MRLKRDPIACLETWTDELMSRSERVRKLIGDAHWLSDGHHKEEIVREFLRRHLSGNITVSRGFIVPPESALPVSKEIDVLLTNASLGPPWFFEGELCITPPCAVLGQLHVKTKFGTKELADVFFSTNATSKSLTNQNSTVQTWCGALFFVPPENASVKTLKKCFQDSIKAANYSPAGFLPKTFPDFVAVLGGPVFILELKRSDNPKTDLFVRAYDCPKLGPALLLNHLYDTVILPECQNHRRTDWTKLLAEEDYPAIFSDTFTI
jgi:hypothetical protein